MKRVSVYVLVTLSLIIAATINDWYMTRLDWVSYYRNDFSSHANLLSDETLLAKSYLQSGQNLEQLTRLLQSRVRVGALDFWVLYHDSDLYQSNLHAQEISVMQFVQEDGAGILLEKQYAYNTRSLSEGFTLVAGLRYNEEAFVSRAFAQRQRVFFIYLAGLTSLALLIFFYFFNDIFSSIHRLGQRQRSFSGIQAHSKEANQLLQSISAFAAQTDDLEKERNLLRGIELRMVSILPPVWSPNMVPRSYSRLNST